MPVSQVAGFRGSCQVLFVVVALLTGVLAGCRTDRGRATPERERRETAEKEPRNAPEKEPLARPEKD
jgi:hypothetical protein